MPLQVMDPSKNEGKGKLHTGKKQEGSKEKSILDFFKTPERALVKQKSLLQFFGKTSASDIEGTKTGTDSAECEEKDKENLTQKRTDEDTQESKSEAKTSTCRKLEIKEKETKISNVCSESVEDKAASHTEVVVNDESSGDSVILCETENKDEVEEKLNEEDIKITENDKDYKKINGETETHGLEPTIEMIKEKTIIAGNITKEDKDDEGLKEDKDDEGKNCNVTEDVVPKVSKKNNLKVKDMLDLLKEVQVCERIEKKKKSKHKLRKHKTKDTHEIHIEESGMAVSTDVVKCTEIDSKPTGEQIEDNENQDETDANTKKEKMDSKEKKKEDSKVNKTKETAEENPHEMSYTEFLAKLSQNETEDMEVDVINVEGVEREEELDSVNDVEMITESDVNLMKHESDQMITNFFNFTSTPGKDNIVKKEKKDKSLKNEVANNKKGKQIQDTKAKKEEKEPQLKDSIVKKEDKMLKDDTAKKGKKGKPLKKSIEKKENKTKAVVGDVVSDETNNSNTSHEVDTNSEENKAKKNEFLQSKVNIPSKTTQQATLSFGSDGFKMSKEKANTDSSKDQKQNSVSNKKTVVRNIKKKANNEIVELDASTMSESAFLTPVQKKTRKRKSPAKAELSTDLDESDLTDQMDSAGQRRSQRKKYKVTVFQMDEERKTPIKIKLRRCVKSSSTENEDHEKSADEKLSKAKANVKLTKAQALLEKAKNRIHKTKLRKQCDKEPLKPNNKTVEKLKHISNKKEAREKIKKVPKKKRHESEEGNARRSSRLEGKSKVSMEEVSMDNIVISSDEDEMAKPMKKKKKKGGAADVVPIKTHLTPVKGAKGKSPVKKSGAKLAPMFLMGKKKAAESPIKPALNPEQAKQRQMFLMSGVPEELKKQTAIRQANTLVSSYPPIPTVNHVQQIQDTTDTESKLKDLNVWKLDKVCLNLKPDDMQVLPPLKSSFVSTLVSKKNKESTFQTLEKPKALDDCTVEKCLNEIMASNPSYPVKMMYKAFRESKLYGEDGPNKTDSQEMRTDMKGILSEDIEKKETKPKTSKRKSLKLNKKDNMETESVEDKPTSLESTFTGSSLQWTDKYYPAKASEILGNGGSLKKLKDWLLEWKQVLAKEAKKARKLLMKKKKGKTSSAKDTKDSDFDSDFDMDSDDSDDDDMSLCNTTLLVGPHGAGKTSSVYALAQELGYKVHEVNASSSRSGRQILSQLQEATQSHQVSSQGCHTPSKKKGIMDKVQDNKTQPKSKMALSFTNLLQKQPATEPKKPDIGQKKAKKQKADKGDKSQKEVKDVRSQNIKNKQMAALISEDSNSQSISPSINLSRTTLILFEEVDVAFEEDKGFLAAVQTFMSTTKIPILLTSTKRGFSPSFEGRFEVINIKRPSVSAVTSHLQTIALTENLRTDYVKLSELVKLNNCDVRRCLLMMQFLVETGGSNDKDYRVLKDVSIGEKLSETVPNNTVENSTETLSNTNVEKSDDDLDDFIVLKGRQNKRRRILEDADSNSGDVGTGVPLVSVVEGAGSQEEAQRCPVVYGLGLRCLLPSPVQCQQSILEFIKQYLQKETDLPKEDLMEICQTFNSIARTSLFYSNLHLLLPLSISVTDNITHLPRLQECGQKKGKKRKRIMSDLYDSEGSDTENGPADINEETEKPIEDSNKLEHSSTKTDTSYVIKSLQSFSNFYDTMASLDVMRSCSDMKIQDRVCTLGSIKAQTVLPPGLEDDLCNLSSDHEQQLETKLDIESCIETRAFCKLSRNIQCVKEEMEGSVDTSSDQWDQFTLPVTPGMDVFQMKDTVSLSTSLEAQRALNDVTDNLPYTLTKNTRCIHVDYLPTLREICRCESTRLTANTKRRFHHYFDNITLPLRDKTMNILASTLT